MTGVSVPMQVVVQISADDAERRAVREIIREEVSRAIAEGVMTEAAELAALRQKESLTPDEVKALFGIEVRQLQDWRSSGIGPRYVKAADRTVLYRADAVREFLSLKTVRTHDAA